MDISDLQREVHAFTVAKGWWDYPEADRVNRLLDWIIEEVEEAREAYRLFGTRVWVEKDAQGLPKPEGFGVELGDILLLVLDLAAGTEKHTRQLEYNTTTKLAYNKVRKYRRDAEGRTLDVEGGTTK